MKIKLIITIAISAFTLTSIAQTEKGTFLLGGSIGYSSNENKSSSRPTTSKSNFITISPKMGYFIDNNFAIGAKLDYTTGKNKYRTSDYENSTDIFTSFEKSNRYGISPFARYYISLTETLKFYGELEMLFETGKSKKTDEEGNTLSLAYKFNTYRPALSPGLVLFPSKKWAIEFSFPLISFEKRTYWKVAEGNSKSNTNSFDFGLNTFNPKLGFNYHF